MGDRYQPGSSILSFLNEENVNYVDEGKGAEGKSEAPSPSLTIADQLKIAEEAKAETQVISEVVATDAVLPTEEPAADVEAAAEAGAEAGAVVETYVPDDCPCKKNRSFLTQLGSVKESFTSKESYIVDGRNGKLAKALQRFGINAKNKMTGQGKTNKSPAEKFCNEHWHVISNSIVTLIAFIMLALCVLTFFGIVNVIFNITPGSQRGNAFA